jgi:transcriptional regulator with XRE-family HTH domain
MTSGTPLKRILLEEGRKQSWLAEKVGIDQPTLSRIVNGLHCDAATCERIALALGRDVAELFPDRAAA